MLFNYNEIPSKPDDNAKAWFYGKLLLAAFCETRAGKAVFPLKRMPHKYKSEAYGTDSG